MKSQTNQKPPGGLTSRRPWKYSARKTFTHRAERRLGKKLASIIDL